LTERPGRRQGMIMSAVRDKNLHHHLLF